MARKHDDLTVQKRRDAIEVQMRTGNWSRKIARALAEKWGVSIRQIYRDRSNVLKEWKANLGSLDRSTAAAQLLEEVRALRSATAAKGMAQDDARMIRNSVELMRLEMSLLDLDKPTEVHVHVEPQEDVIQLAQSVMDVLPMAARVLNFEEPTAVIEAAFTEPTIEDTDEP